MGHHCVQVAVLGGEAHELSFSEGLQHAASSSSCIASVGRIPARISGVAQRNSEMKGASDMAKDHGSSIKNDEQYEGLRKKGMSKSRAAAIANSEGASSRGGKKSGSGSASKSDSSQGGTTQQKKAAGRKGGKAAAGKS